jgi:simple sugar transport system ATP-binding protein
MHRGSLSPARPAEAWTLASIGLAMAGTHAAEAAPAPH